MRNEKYLVIRKDGSIPRWPYFVLSANDPASQAALEAYIAEARKLEYGSRYLRELESIADIFATFDAEGKPDEPDQRNTCEFVHRLIAVRSI